MIPRLVDIECTVNDDIQYRERNEFVILEERMLLRYCEREHRPIVRKKSRLSCRGIQSNLSILVIERIVNRRSQNSTKTIVRNGQGRELHDTDCISRQDLVLDRRP